MWKLFARKREAVPVAEHESEVTAWSPDELRRRPKTTDVLVTPSVVAGFLEKAASHRGHEVGSLLLGRIEGRFLVVEDQVFLQDVGTAASVDFTPRDFENALEAAKGGQCVVGWAHSHPGHGVFLSGTDVRHQAQSQELFPDYVALVMDPFRRQGVEYGFYRVEEEYPRRVPHAFLEEPHAA